MLDKPANRDENPAEVEITQEMIDIARESILSNEDLAPEQPTRKRSRWSHAIMTLAMLVIQLIGIHDTN